MQTASEIAAAVRTRRVSALEVARAAVERAEALNPRLNAFLGIFQDKALAAAADVDARVAAGESPPLAGVSVALKDNMCLGPDLAKAGDGRGYGGRTTAGSRILEKYESPFTATAAPPLNHAGAVIAGQTNPHEFPTG